MSRKWSRSTPVVRSSVVLIGRTQTQMGHCRHCRQQTADTCIGFSHSGETGLRLGLNNTHERAATSSQMFSQSVAVTIWLLLLRLLRRADTRHCLFCSVQEPPPPSGFAENLLPHLYFIGPFLSDSRHLKIFFSFGLLIA